MKQYYVYMLKSCDNRWIYTGLTTDPKRRLLEHNGILKTSKVTHFTTKGRPWSLMYVEPAANRSLATKREIQIKKLTRAQKLKLI